MSPELSFTAEVKLVGINPYVDVPEHMVNTLGGGAIAPVLVKVSEIDGMINKGQAPPKKGRLSRDAANLEAIGQLAPGGWFRSTLVPLRSEPIRLYLYTWMRESGQVEGGDGVRVTLKPDSASRELSMPAALRTGLNSNAKAKAAWEALAPSHQCEILTYLNFLKKPASLERNVHKVITELTEEENRDN